MYHFFSEHGVYGIVSCEWIVPDEVECALLTKFTKQQSSQLRVAQFTAHAARLAALARSQQRRNGNLLLRPSINTHAQFTAHRRRHCCGRLLTPLLRRTETLMCDVRLGLGHESLVSDVWFRLKSRSLRAKGVWGEACTRPSPCRGRLRRQRFAGGSATAGSGFVALRELHGERVQLDPSPQYPVADGANVWNDLPSDVTSASSLSVFNNRLKTYLFRRCYETV